MKQEGIIVRDRSQENVLVVTVGKIIKDHPPSVNYSSSRENVDSSSFSSPITPPSSSNSLLRPSFIKEQQKRQQQQREQEKKTQKKTHLQQQQQQQQQQTVSSLDANADPVVKVDDSKVMLEPKPKTTTTTMKSCNVSALIAQLNNQQQQQQHQQHLQYEQQQQQQHGIVHTTTMQPTSTSPEDVVVVVAQLPMLHSKYSTTPSCTPSPPTPSFRKTYYRETTTTTTTTTAPAPAPATTETSQQGGTPEKVVQEVAIASPGVSKSSSSSPLVSTFKKSLPAFYGPNSRLMENNNNNNNNNNNKQTNNINTNNDNPQNNKNNERGMYYPDFHSSKQQQQQIIVDNNNHRQSPPRELVEVPSPPPPSSEPLQQDVNPREIKNSFESTNQETLSGSLSTPSTPVSSSTNSSSSKSSPKSNNKKKSNSSFLLSRRANRLQAVIDSKIIQPTTTTTTATTSKSIGVVSSTTPPKITKTTISSDNTSTGVKETDFCPATTTTTSEAGSITTSTTLMPLVVVESETGNGITRPIFMGSSDYKKAALFSTTTKTATTTIVKNDENENDNKNYNKNKNNIVMKGNDGIKKVPSSPFRAIHKKVIHKNYLRHSPLKITSTGSVVRMKEDDHENSKNQQQQQQNNNNKSIVLPEMSSASSLSITTTVANTMNTQTTNSVPVISSSTPDRLVRGQRVCKIQNLQDEKLKILQEKTTTSTTPIAPVSTTSTTTTTGSSTSTSTGGGCEGAERIPTSLHESRSFLRNYPVLSSPPRMLQQSSVVPTSYTGGSGSSGTRSEKQVEHHDDDQQQQEQQDPTKYQEQNVSSEYTHREWNTTTQENEYDAENNSTYHVSDGENMNESFTIDFMSTNTSATTYMATNINNNNNNNNSPSSLPVESGGGGGGGSGGGEAVTFVQPSQSQSNLFTLAQPDPPGRDSGSNCRQQRLSNVGGIVVVVEQQQKGFDTTTIQIPDPPPSIVSVSKNQSFIQQYPHVQQVTVVPPNNRYNFSNPILPTIAVEQAVPMLPEVAISCPINYNVQYNDDDDDDVQEQDRMMFDNPSSKSSFDSMESFANEEWNPSDSLIDVVGGGGGDSHIYDAEEVNTTDEPKGCFDDDNDLSQALSQNPSTSFGSISSHHPIDYNHDSVNLRIRSPPILVPSRNKGSFSTQSDIGCRTTTGFQPVLLKSINESATTIGATNTVSDSMNRAIDTLKALVVSAPSYLVKRNYPLSTSTHGASNSDITTAVTNRRRKTASQQQQQQQQRDGKYLEENDAPDAIDTSTESVSTGCDDDNNSTEDKTTATESIDSKSSRSGIDSSTAMTLDLNELKLELRASNLENLDTTVHLDDTLANSGFVQYRNDEKQDNHGHLLVATASASYQYDNNTGTCSTPPGRQSPILSQQQQQQQHTNSIQRTWSGSNQSVDSNGRPTPPRVGIVVPPRDDSTIYKPVAAIPLTAPPVSFDTAIALAGILSPTSPTSATVVPGTPTQVSSLKRGPGDLHSSHESTPFVPTPTTITQTEYQQLKSGSSSPSKWKLEAAASGATSGAITPIMRMRSHVGSSDNLTNELKVGEQSGFLSSSTRDSDSKAEREFRASKQKKWKEKMKLVEKEREEEKRVLTVNSDECSTKPGSSLASGSILNRRIQKKKSKKSAKVKSMKKAEQVNQESCSTENITQNPMEIPSLCQVSFTGMLKRSGLLDQLSFPRCLGGLGDSISDDDDEDDEEEDDEETDDEAFRKVIELEDVETEGSFGESFETEDVSYDDESLTTATTRQFSTDVDESDGYSHTSHSTRTSVTGPKPIFHNITSNRTKDEVTSTKNKVSLISQIANSTKNVLETNRVTQPRKVTLTEQHPPKATPVIGIRDKNFIRAFIQEITTKGIQLFLHTKSRRQSLAQPNKVVATIQLGGRIVQDGNFSIPNLVWTATTTTTVADDSTAITVPVIGGANLFKIRSLDKASALQLEDYPIAMPGHSLILRMNDGVEYVFETTSESATLRFIHGMKWVIARLSFNLIIGNLSVSCELLAVDRSGGSSADDDGKFPKTLKEEAQWTKAMNDATNELIEISACHLQNSNRIDI